MRMDERQLFWMIKRQIAQKEAFICFGKKGATIYRTRF